MTGRQKPPPNRRRATGADGENAERSKRSARKAGKKQPKRAAKATPEEQGESRSNRRLERPPSQPEIDLLEQPPPREPRWNLKERFPRFWRSAALVLKVVVASACVVGGVSVYRLVHDYVIRAPAFAITDLEVVGLERVEEEALLDAVDLHLGDNVFRHDVEALRDRVLRHPWIATAEVDRRLPGRVSITVTEHEPVAVLALRGLYLVSADGTVFKAVELGDPVDLPVVSGLDEGEFVRNRAFRTAVLLEAVALMHDYRSAGLWRREPIAEIRVEPTGGLSLRVGDDAMLVRLGRGPHRAKLRRLRQILDRLDRSESRAEYVYLDNARRPDRVTVRLREEPAPPEDDAEG